MSAFTAYTIATGRILAWGDCQPADVEFQAPSEDDAVHEGEKVHGDLFYMPGGVKTERPMLDAEAEYTIAADGVDAVAFVLPAGSTVWHGDAVWEDEDAFLFTSEAAGTFVFRIEPAFPYQGPVKVVIHAA